MLDACESIIDVIISPTLKLLLKRPIPGKTGILTLRITRILLPLILVFALIKMEIFTAAYRDAGVSYPLRIPGLA
jgi:hypothetical protein